MTPATKTKTTNPLDELAALEAEVSQIAAEASKLGRQHFEAQERYRALIDANRARVQQAPTEYDGAMRPLKGTTAEQIQQELEEVGRVDFSQEITLAEHRKRIAQREVAEYVFSNAEAIARELTKLGDQAAREVNEAVAAVVPACARYQGLVSRYQGIVGSLPGAISGQDIESDGRVNEIAQVANQLAEVEVGGVRSVSLDPRGGAAVRYVRGPDGDGFIGVEHR